MAELTVISSKDNWATNASGNEDTNYSTLYYLYVISYTGYTRRAYLAFDISSLPAGAVISSATLSLYYWSYAASNPTGRQIDVFKITRNDWVEAEQTWNSYKSGSAWTAAGGDYVTSNPAGANTNCPAAAGAWMNWDVKAIVEDAVTNEVNVNVVAKMNVENEGDYEPLFYAKEYNTDTSLRPKLVIVYTVSSSSSSSSLSSSSSSFSSSSSSSQSSSSSSSSQSSSSSSSSKSSSSSSSSFSSSSSSSSFSSSSSSSSFSSSSSSSYSSSSFLSSSSSSSSLSSFSSSSSSSSLSLSSSSSSLSSSSSSSSFSSSSSSSSSSSLSSSSSSSSFSSSSSSFSSSSSSSSLSSSSSSSLSSSSSSSSFSSSSSSSSFSSSSSSSSLSSSSSSSSLSSSSSSSSLSSSSSSLSSSSSSSSFSSSSSSSSFSSSSSSSSFSSSSSSSSFSSSSSSSSFSSSSSSLSFSSSSSSSSSSFSSSSSSSSCSLDPTKSYSRGNYLNLPADDSTLETPFICTDYPKVATDDNIYVQQCARDTLDPYGVFVWKDKHINSTDVIVSTCKLKVSRASSTNTVYLQIYNRNSGLWETLDSDNVTAADTEFTLNGTQTTNLSYYYDGSFFATHRIYQKVE